MLVSDISNATPPQPTAQSSSTGSFYVKPYVGRLFGKTEYVMDAKDYDDFTVVHVKSQLEFPLDVTIAGAAMGFNMSSSIVRNLWGELGVYSNVGDPGGKMYDHDWWNLRTGTLEKFSYTESDAEMKSLLVTLEGGFEITDIGPSANLSIIGGFWYHRIEQNIIGFAGWQLDENGNSYEFDIPDTVALFYRVIYRLPHAGIRLDFNPSLKLSLNAKAALALVWVSDYDDHLLRNKLATASIIGKGIISGFEVLYNPFNINENGFFLGARGDFVYLTASGSQTQEWYDDEYGFDPYTGEEVLVAEKGTVYTGIPHDINSIQLRFGFSVGYRF